MPRGRAKPKALDTPYYSLTKPEDLLELLKDVLKLGWQGALFGQPEADGEVWGIQLNHTQHGQFTAALGEVVLLDGEQLSAIPGDQFKERWDAK